MIRGTGCGQRDDRVWSDGLGVVRGMRCGQRDGVWSERWDVVTGDTAGGVPSHPRL